MLKQKYTLLDKINSPEDLKQIPQKDLAEVCKELREYIIDVLCENSGHLGANLGVIELTVALHYVFNAPNDKIVWDVGHQAYAHKILTGRRDSFPTNRKKDGLSGFPKISESEYDAFGTGHSSTSISATLGMAIASAQNGDKDRQHIAIIGDGSMTGGMAFEALDHAGVSDTNILIILNDNGIAIDKNVGALKEYFTDITLSRTYNKFKTFIWRIMGGNRKIGSSSRNLVRQINSAIKGSITKRSNYFEALKFRYFGPVDGHDVIRLANLLNDLKRIPGPKLLHIVTKKGKGFRQAEKDQTTFHAPGKFDKTTGELIKGCQAKTKKFQDVFGTTIIELAKKNKDIIAVTPAMLTGSSLNLMQDVMPDRVFDVGIAEQHAVTFSAGLATMGKMPFCNIYSSFFQRAYDQLIHDVALQELNVVFCLDRAGVVGADGPTHHGVFDLAFMNLVPNITIAAPMDENELRDMMFTAQQKDMGVFSIRYPRGRGFVEKMEEEFKIQEVGKARCIKEGENIAILSLGICGNFALEAANRLKKEGINVAVYDFRYLKPFDTDMLDKITSKFNQLITVEDGAKIGGFGSTVAQKIVNKNSKLEILGINDQFIEHGTQEELYAIIGIDANSIYEKVKSLVG